MLLLGADGLGSCHQRSRSPLFRGVRRPRGALLQNAFSSAPVDLNPDGDFEVRGRLTDSTGATPPLDCGNTVDNRPVLLVRAVTPANPTTGAPAIPSAWFAAGIIDSGRDSHRD